MIDFSDFICPNRSKWEIGRISDEFRNKYWKGKPLPIDMELLIEKELGLEVIPETYIKELTKTDAYLTRDLTAIIIDWDQYMDEDDRWANRLRFSMAHEVGHFVLHRNINQEWINTDELYIEFHKHAPERERRTFEGQANEFAGSLLVPREMLIAEIHKLVDKINHEGIANLLQIQKYSDDILARNLGSLAYPFGVSTDVMKIRVQVERLWPPPEEMLY